MKYKITIEYDNRDGDYDPAHLKDVVEDAVNSGNFLPVAEVISMEPIEEEEADKLPAWTCPCCGTNCFPDYYELEVRITVVKGIVEKTVQLGDTLDYVDPDDMPGPTHWFLCPDCKHRIECAGYHIEPM